MYRQNIFQKQIKWDNSFTSLYEPKQLDQQGSKKIEQKFPPLVVGDSKFLNNYFRASNIEESTCCKAGEDNVDELSLIGKDHSNHNTDWGGDSKQKYAESDRLKVIWEGLYERDTQGERSSTFVSNDGNSHVHDLRFFFGDSEGKSFENWMDWQSQQQKIRCNISAACLLLLDFLIELVIFFVTSSHLGYGKIK